MCMRGNLEFTSLISSAQVTVTFAPSRAVTMETSLKVPKTLNSVIAHTLQYPLTQIA